VVADDLAAQPDAGDSLGREDGLFGLGDVIGLTGHELDPTGRTPSVPPASVELVNLGIIRQSQDEPLPIGHIKRPNPLDCQLRHDSSFETM
jgi:hypothetical protein